jgi:prepilin-type N-terminal cleavage/methylation domain-containing protein
MNKNAFTLVELLVALAITSIMMLGVYMTYISFTRKSIDTRQIAKTEAEINQGFFKLEKYIESAGFGIDSDKQFLKIKSTNDEITFTTLFAEKTESGLWEVCINGERSETVSFPVVALTEEKRYKETIERDNENCNTGTILYVCKDTDNNGECDDPYYYEITFRLSANNADTYAWSKHCAPGTKNLLMDINGISNPFLGCVADFNIEHDTNNDKKLKIGIVFQKGLRQDSKISKTFDYELLDNDSYTLTNEQEYYRWQKSEMLIDLINLN